MILPHPKMISQILRFNLPYPQTISSPGFRRLRETVSKVCISQYWGYTVSAPLPRKTEEVCWAIRRSSILDKIHHDGVIHAYSLSLSPSTADWPATSTAAERAETLASSSDGSNSIIGNDATSLLLEFDDDQVPALIKAFEARVCEFVSPSRTSPPPLA